MKTSPGRKALSHERIVQVASQAVRRDGFHGVGVADVMRRAGLTHGGFYAHFESRDALLAEAVAHAGRDLAAGIGAHIERLAAQGMSGLRALIEIYLSEDHVRDCEGGCPAPALCADMPRQAPVVLDASRGVIVSLHGLIRSVLPAGVASEAAWSIASALVGAVQLARALGDTEEGRAVLAATRDELLARYDA